MSASPQLEDGFVQIATELLLALACAGLTARQWAVVAIIIRKTYGFNKKVDDIGLSQISELTGIAKPHVSVAVRELAERRIITRKVGKFGHIMGINKDYSQWLPVTKSVTRAAQIPSADNEVEEVTESVTVTDPVTVTEAVTEGLPNQYPGGYRIGKAGVTESVTTIDNPTKDNYQKTKSCAPKSKREPKRAEPAGTMQDRFDRFYAAYPRKKSKEAAKKIFAKLNPDEQLLTAILAGIERAMTSGTWSDPKFIPHPSTWLGGMRWQDDIQTEYSTAERAVIQAFNDALGEQLGVVSDSPFIESRAAAIREFTTFSDKPDWVARFFPWVRDFTTLPPSVGFDWLISRKGFANAKDGQHTRKAA